LLYPTVMGVTAKEFVTAVSPQCNCGMLANQA